MKIGKDSVVSIDYKLTDEAGTLVDESGGEPLEYLHGHDQIVPGLERALEGKEAGASVTVSVAPAEGYGDRDEEQVLEIERTQLPKKLVPKLGMQLAVSGEDGEPMPVWVTGFTDSHVTLDANHPMAGKTLNFAVDVRNVRAASAEELEHGHSHGAHGHHHH